MEFSKSRGFSFLGSSERLYKKIKNAAIKGRDRVRNASVLLSELTMSLIILPIRVRKEVRAIPFPKYESAYGEPEQTL
jgi:hypothetical protein